ncbi:hypothetical protein WMY93_007223 [Mugilogobius chulae]|uniref:Vesicle transport protein n=1 Tax=Mugilogobius chulae TaxID=88201 RepID=A0AAW0Q225_9GOBI
MDKLKSVLSGEEARREDRTILQASTLSWATRIKGFIVCFIIGVGCTILLYVSDGPVKQLKRMCDKTRALATTIMITCLVLTLCAAFWWKNLDSLCCCHLASLSFAWETIRTSALLYLPPINNYKSKHGLEAILKLVSISTDQHTNRGTAEHPDGAHPEATYYHLPSRRISPTANAGDTANRDKNERRKEAQRRGEEEKQRKVHDQTQTGERVEEALSREPLRPQNVWPNGAKGPEIRGGNTAKRSG